MRITVIKVLHAISTQGFDPGGIKFLALKPDPLPTLTTVFPDVAASDLGRMASDTTRVQRRLILA
jgi:hypothetical protein